MSKMFKISINTLCYMLYSLLCINITIKLPETPAILIHAGIYSNLGLS